RERIDHHEQTRQAEVANHEDLHELRQHVTVDDSQHVGRSPIGDGETRDSSETLQAPSRRLPQPRKRPDFAQSRFPESSVQSRVVPTKLLALPRICTHDASPAITPPPARWQ